MGLEKKYEYEGNKYISIGIESDAIKENASEVLDNVLNHYTKHCIHQDTMIAPRRT